MAKSNTRRLVEDLKRLIQSEARIKAGLPPAVERDDISAGRGVGLASRSAVKSSGGGIDSPLTERAGARTLYTERYVFSTDGIFAIAYRPVLTATFDDAAGREVGFIYVDPDA